MTFLPNPQYKPQVNHKNCNKHDNRVANLEWVTWKENWEHGRDHGKYKGIMLSDEKQLELYELYQQGGHTQPQLARRFGISKSSVYRHIIKQKQNSIKLAA